MPVLLDNRHPHLKVDQRQLATHLRKCLAALGRHRAEVSVSLVDDAEIRQLNREFRAVDSVTDVLSFAMEDGESLPGMPVELLGDIVVSLDTAQRQALELAAQQKLPEYALRQEVWFLATHGLLHLLGFDHQEADEAEEMEALEKRLMEGVSAADLHGYDRTSHAKQG